MKPARSVRSCIFLLTALLTAEEVLAQGGPLSFEFRFSNPGARSLAFGGAFVALADDATAVFSNPAGLVQLVRSEVSIEGRRVSSTTRFTAGGRLSGEPTGIGLDDVPGLRFDESSSVLSGLSFVSFVFPKEDWAVAVYGHQLAKFRAESQTQGFFLAAPDGVGTLRADDFVKSTEFEIFTYGFSGSYRVNDRLSLGVGVGLFVGESTDRTDAYAPLELTLPEGPFGPNAYAEAARDFTIRTRVDDSSWSYNFGALWQISSEWRLAGSFRRGPRFDFEGVSISGPAGPDPEGSSADAGTLPIKLPDVVSLGLVYRSPGGTTTVSAEWDHVGYSTIIDSLDPDVAGTEGISIPDANEIHAGVEYALLQWKPALAFRFGLWIEPDHRFRASGVDLLTMAILRAGESQLHYAAGVGVAFQSFQLDFGLDFSDLASTASLSAILSF